ncbi:hypothetical protein BDZ91DRAFT_712464 [Kalaharituber pfeilii]|nr:hypothetical protein BDZ91DRAFT_712464 [Kalaharituber pfeilii]
MSSRITVPVTMRWEISFQKPSDPLLLPAPLAVLQFSEYCPLRILRWRSKIDVGSLREGFWERRWRPFPCLAASWLLAPD